MRITNASTNENKCNFGKSLHIDLYDAYCSSFTENQLKQFVEQLIADVKMKIEGGIHCKYYMGRDKQTEGYSIQCFLDCSSFSMHTAPFDRRIYIDLFSCKPINILVVMDRCKMFFGTSKMNYVVLDR